MDERVAEAVEKIKKRVNIDAVTGLILGSGLGSLTDEFSNMIRIKYDDIPNFPSSSVKGHKGEVVAGRFSGIDVLAFSGRVHYYEGYTMKEVCFSVEVMAGMGIEKLIITNASGAVNESYSPGDIIIIKDHINLTGDNPLRGSSNFIDMTDAYSKRLRTLARESAAKLGMDTHEGVYMIFPGPSYESPAEIRMAGNMGADLVGMSTIPEVIMANSQGMEVLGLSMITNMAAGITGNSLSHDEVIETTKTSAERFKTFVAEIVRNI
ncbi:purine-nucleoside phosphorylase [Thermodesulfobacteriota bacterium]